MSVRGFISSCKGNAGVVEDDKLTEKFGKLLGADASADIVTIGDCWLHRFTVFHRFLSLNLFGRALVS
jgi:hypothetical protein